jgi:pyruvate-formate lyase-activating enzyme
MSISISTDQIMDLLQKLGGDKETMLTITGEEPLLQKEGILKSIKSVKSKTNYIVMLETNGSLIEEDFIVKANDMSLDGVVLPFYDLEEERHRRYTGWSNRNTINALKMLTEKFKGQIVVYIVLFSHIDMLAFENMCKFLFEINPNFVIQILCSHQKDEEFFKKYNEAKEIASNYFKRIDLSHYFSKEIKMIRYQIVEDEKGQMNLEKKNNGKR